MLDLGNVVVGGLLFPIDTTGATTVSTTAFDTATLGGGINSVLAVAITGNVAADMTGLLVTECETSGGTYTTVTGAAFTSPTAAAGDNKAYAALIPMGGLRKRYLKISATGGAGATLVCGLILGERANQTPSSATERGLQEFNYCSNGA